MCLHSSGFDLNISQCYTQAQHFHTSKYLFIIKVLLWYIFNFVITENQLSQFNVMFLNELKYGYCSFILDINAV